MTRRWVGGVFGNTIGTDTSVTDASGIFTTYDQYYLRQEGGWGQLGESGNPASSAEALRIAGITTDGLYYINTPDGGEQQVYCMFTSGAGQGGDHGWMLVGRYAADAKTTVASVLSSARSMIDVTQNGDSKWSADFGTYTPAEVRIIGCSNSSDWMGNRTTDWIYVVPSNHNLIRFLTNQTDYTNTGNVSQGTVPSDDKQGNLCAGARDGRGRWNNSNYIHHRISDNNAGNYCKPGYFKSPGTSMWYYNAGTDAKWTVANADTKSGQDDAASALFGYDDGAGPSWFDNNQTEVAQGTVRVDSGFNTAAFVFIR
jgi:hypothetical protein